MEFDVIKSLVENKKYSAITEYSRIVNPSREDIIVTEYTGSDVTVYKDDRGNVRLLCPKNMDYVTEGHVAQAISNGTIFDDATDVDNNATMIERTSLPYDAMINSGKPTPKHLKPMIAIIIGKMDRDGSCAVSDADRMNGVNFIKDLCNKEEPVKKTVHIVGHWIGKAPQDFYTPEMGKSITQLDKEVDNIKSTKPEDCISDDDCCESYNGYDMKKIESDPSEDVNKEDEEKDEVLNNENDNDFDEEENKDSEDENESDENDDDETDEEESDMDDDMDDNDSDSDDTDNDTDDEDFDVDDDIPDVEDSSDDESDSDDSDNDVDDEDTIEEYMQDSNDSAKLYQESKQTHFKRTLKKFDYDPKTDTILTDIELPGGKDKMRVKLSIDDEIAQTMPPVCVTNLIIRDKDGKIIGVDDNKYEIHILRKVLKQKEWKSAFALKHEEGHIAHDHINLKQGKPPINPSYDKDKSDQETFKVKKFFKDEKIHNKLNDHDRDKIEYVADKYAAEHTSKMSTIKGIKSLYDTGEKDLLRVAGLYDDYMTTKKRISLIKKKMKNISEADIKLINNRLDVLNKKINEYSKEIDDLEAEISKSMKKDNYTDFNEYIKTTKGKDFLEKGNKLMAKCNELTDKRQKIQDKDPSHLLKVAEEELDSVNDLLKTLDLGCKTRQKFIKKYVKESFDITDIDQFNKYCTILEQFDDNTTSVPKELYTNKPIQNNDVDPTMNYPHANRMVEETDEPVGGTEVTQPDGSVNTVNMPLSAQTKTMVADKVANLNNVKQECGDNKCVNQECGDSKLMKQECGDNECVKQEGFFTKKPKKLKPIPRDIIPYITVSMNDIHDANDQAMLSGYTCSKIELVDFYITIIDTQDARYIVPHNRPYLEMMKRELERLLSEILKIRPINRSDQIWRVNYPT